MGTPYMYSVFDEWCSGVDFRLTVPLETELDIGQKYISNSQDV